MNILVLNGSPKGERSNTLHLTHAFLKGLESHWGQGMAVEEITVAGVNIQPCRGCYGCWTATPGRCVIRDDMDEILPKFLWADIVVWSLPLYFYGMPSQVKALMDRTLPHSLPFMEERADGGSDHPSRYDHQAKVVLVSSCGFYARQNNYEALLKQFDIYTSGACTALLCPEGELFSRAELRGRTEAYLLHVQAAGREYAATGVIAPKTKGLLEELLYPPAAFVEMADASWDIREEPTAVYDALVQEHSPQEESLPVGKQALAFTRQMAALYQPAAFDGRERVLEMCYTDCDLTCQLVLGAQRCSLRTEDFTPYTTRIETPLAVWQAIARGEYSGEEGMMEGKYRTLGDIHLLMDWDCYFGDGLLKGTETAGEKAPATMNLLLLPWVIFWTAVPISPLWGGALALLAGAGIPLAGIWRTLTPYDSLTGAMVPLLGLWAAVGGGTASILVSYLLFGLLWFLSCYTKVPLTAHYSKVGYGGDRALKNPVFLRCNLILTRCWGILYLLTPLWSWALLQSSLASYTGLINSILPAILGGFTFWFERWYPSYVAGGRRSIR